MAHCMTRVDLTVACDNLLDTDATSKSDPLCVLMTDASGVWIEVCHRKWKSVYKSKFFFPIIVIFIINIIIIIVIIIIVLNIEKKCFLKIVLISIPLFKLL